MTDEKNDRRCDLIDVREKRMLSLDERVELEQLQDEMLAHRRKVAPLPIEDLKQLKKKMEQAEIPVSRGSRQPYPEGNGRR